MAKALSIAESLRKSVILLLLVLLLALAFQVKAVTIDSNIQFIVGNETYTVNQTNDTSDNTVVSSSYNFLVVPNWDINIDGVVNIFDLVVVSNHYGETWWEV